MISHLFCFQTSIPSHDVSRYNIPNLNDGNINKNIKRYVGHIKWPMKFDYDLI